MTLDYLPSTSIAILRLADLNLRQKLLLSLVSSFNSNGLKASNESLGEILDIWPSRVSHLLRDMESKGYIRIDKSQSQYRRIYLLQSATVALATKRNTEGGALATKRTSTVAQSRNRIEVSKSLSKNRERGRTHFQKPTPAEVAEYAKTIGYVLDGEYFCDTYEARGWLIGRSLMRDWRATVRTWKRRNGSQNGNQNTKTRTDNAGPNPVARAGEFIR
jgi:DNA-binding PadR family transcriptional regulator